MISNIYAYCKKIALSLAVCLAAAPCAHAADASAADGDTARVLKEVDIMGAANKYGARSSQMSAVEISAAKIKVTPAIFGEADVLKTLQQMPGVVQGDDGKAAIYVRGGDYDQNLITIDGAPFYNSEHMAGFASAINPDMVSKVDFFTGAFPSRYGGRLSGIADISLREGSYERYSASASVGMLSSRLSAEGPIRKGRSSFLVSGRASYFDAIVKRIFKRICTDPAAMDSYSKIDFYDLSLKTSFRIGQEGKLAVSAYFSRDVYDTAPSKSSGHNDDTGLGGTYRAKVAVVPSDGLRGGLAEPVYFAPLRSATESVSREYESSTESSWTNFLASARYDGSLKRGISLSVSATASMLWSNFTTRQTSDESNWLYRNIRVYDQSHKGMVARPENEYFKHRRSAGTEVQRMGSDVSDFMLNASMSKTLSSHRLSWGAMAEASWFKPTVSIKRDFTHTEKLRTNMDETWIWTRDDILPTEDNFERYGTHVYEAPNYATTESVEHTVANTGRRQSLGSAAIYAEDDWEITPALKACLGLRLASYFTPGKAYARVEPRVSARYMLGRRVALKGSFSMMSQGVHYLYSSNLLVMSGIWVPSTSKAAPMGSLMGAGGFSWDMPLGMSFSAEGYYKTMTNVMEYREGATYLSMPDDWQQLVVYGRGRAFGVDLMLSRDVGKVTGHLRYSWSKALRTFDRPGQELNGGRPFYAPNDRRNVASAMLAYQPNRHWTLSASWNYMTGKRGTLSEYNLFSPYLDEYEIRVNMLGSGSFSYWKLLSMPHLMSMLTSATYRDRNSFVLPACHHLDISVTYSFTAGKTTHQINLSVYNAYNQKNVSRVYLSVDREGKYTLKGLCNFPVMPSLTYTLGF